MSLHNTFLDKAILTKWLSANKYKLVVVLLLLTGYIFLIPGTLFNDPYSTVFTDSQGYLLGSKVADDGQWRFPATDSVPEKVKRATLAFEDRVFYYHPGINPVALFRAARMNLKAGHVVSGGSTLTM